MLVYQFKSSTKDICKTELDALTGGHQYVTLGPQSIFAYWLQTTWIACPLVSNYRDFASLPRADSPSLFTSAYIEKYGDPRNILFRFMLHDQPALYYLLVDTNPYPGYQLDPSPFFEHDNSYRVAVGELLRQLPDGYRQDRVTRLQEFILDMPETEFVDKPGVIHKMDGQRPTRYRHQPKDDPRYDSYVGTQISQHWHTTPLILLVSTLTWDKTGIEIDVPAVECRPQKWITTVINLKRPPRRGSGGLDLGDIYPNQAGSDRWFFLDGHTGINEQWLSWQPNWRQWLTEQVVGKKLPDQFVNRHVKNGVELSLTPAGTLSYLHEQDSPSTIWNVLHPFGAADFGFESYDIDGNHLEPLTVDKSDPVKMVLTFPEPVQGRCHAGISNELDIFYMDRVDYEVVSTIPTPINEYTLTGLAFVNYRLNAFWPGSGKSERTSLDQGRLLDYPGMLELPIPRPEVADYGKDWLVAQLVGIQLPDWTANQVISDARKGTLDFSHCLEMMIRLPTAVEMKRKRHYAGVTRTQKHRKTLDSGRIMDSCSLSDMAVHADDMDLYRYDWLDTQIVGTALADWLFNRTVPVIKEGSLNATIASEDRLIDVMDRSVGFVDEESYWSPPPPQPPPQPPPPPGVTAAPLITEPIEDWDTSVLGTCPGEADGTVIEVFINGDLQGTTLLSNENWVMLALTFVVGDVVTATALAPGKTESAVSNSVVVISAPITTTEGNGVAIAPLNRLNLDSGRDMDSASRCDLGELFQTDPYLWNYALSSQIVGTALEDWQVNRTVPANKSGTLSSTRFLDTLRLCPTEIAPPPQPPPSVTAAPIITEPIEDWDTSAAGTCPGEADGTMIELFINGVSQGTALLSSENWTMLALTFVAGDVVTTTALAPGKTVSAVSNSVVVIPAPVPTSEGNGVAVVPLNRRNLDSGRDMDSASRSDLGELFQADPYFWNYALSSQIVGTALEDWQVNRTVPASKSGTLHSTRHLDTLRLCPTEITGP